MEDIKQYFDFAKFVFWKTLPYKVANVQLKSGYDFNEMLQDFADFISDFLEITNNYNMLTYVDFKNGCMITEDEVLKEKIIDFLLINLEILY